MKKKGKEKDVMKLSERENAMIRETKSMETNDSVMTDKQVNEGKAEGGDSENAVTQKEKNKLMREREREKKRMPVTLSKL